MHAYWTIQDTRKSFTLFCTCVSGQTNAEPRRDLSHPARTKKQIDASACYNSPPPLPTVDMPIIRRASHEEIKHHLLSERVDLDLSTTPPFLKEPRQKLSDESASCMGIFSPVSSLDDDDQRARFGGVKGGRGRVRAKFAEGGFRLRNNASARDSVCASNITHNRGDRFSDGFKSTLVSQTLTDILYRWSLEFTGEARNRVLFNKYI